MLSITHPYRARPIRFLDVVEIGGWRLKLYGISAHAETPPPLLVQRALMLARLQLEEATEQGDGHGLAIVIAHAGADGNYVLIDWWFGENMLRHHLYYTAPDEPDDFEYLTPAAVSYCVWELHILHFERQAWIDHILTRPDAPDVEGYLAQRLNVDI